jgi:hypothetical protein
MFEEAHIAGKKTNHSLRVTGASALFAAGVPERVIQQRTGHRSLDGLRTYERVTEDQNIEVSNILLSNSSTSTTSTKGNDKLTAKENDKPTVKATDLPSLNHPQPSPNHPQPSPNHPQLLPQLHHNLHQLLHVLSSTTIMECASTPYIGIGPIPL